VVKCKQKRDRDFKGFFLSQCPQQKRRGGVVDTQDNIIRMPRAVPAPQEVPVPPGFTLEDILWAIGIWSVIICLSPVIVFYVLMVA
jgi:hypothetical protein